jgi:predicted ATPase/DNA-binding winged helix-turn-helix (wHTH) protein
MTGVSTLSALPGARWKNPEAVPASRPEKAYRFGDFRLVPGRQLLLRGAEPVRLGSRALDLLLLLVEHAGEVVSKEQLIRFAWPSTFVDESNLKVNISTLRSALGCDQAATAYIATIPGRGYRFVAKVRGEADADAWSGETARARKTQALPPPKRLFGRATEIAGLAQDLATTGSLTLTGPAGVGKTAVAVEVARAMAWRYEYGATFIDFTATADPRLVAPLIAAALGLGASAPDPLSAILDGLSGGSRLLVLDNCEHLSSAIGLVVDQIRTRLPDVAVLCTAREPLGYRSEGLRRLATLAYPEDNLIDLDAAMANPSIALFVDRARAASGYDLDEADIPFIAGICRRVDGVALAIELAALHVAQHPPAAILARLAQDFDILAYGPRAAPLRQQGLMTAIEWSYRLLSDAEAAVFRLASVFTRAFTCEEAIAVAGGAGLSPEDVARCVGNLASKSLLQPRFVSGRLAYVMLNAERHYASKRLRQAGEGPPASR